MYPNCVSEEGEDDYYEVYGGDYRTQWMDCVVKNEDRKLWQFTDEIRKREADKRGSANS